MPPADSKWTDLAFPASKVLRDAAEGTDNDASKAAMRRAAANPSGIDMAAEAQKAADRAKAAKAAPAGSTPIAPGTATRDHYKPRR